MILMCAELSQMQWPRNLQIAGSQTTWPGKLGEVGEHSTPIPAQLIPKTTAHNDLTLLHLVSALG